MRLPPEFWKYAREQGFPPRGPRGSPINQERKKMMFPLINQWKKLQKER